MDRVWSGAFAVAGALMCAALAGAGCSNLKAGKTPAHTAALATPADAGASASTSPSTSALVASSASDAGDPYHAAGESIARLDRRIGEIKKHAPTYYNLSAADRAELTALMRAKAALVHTPLSKPLNPDTRALDLTAASTAQKDGAK